MAASGPANTCDTSRTRSSFNDFNSTPPFPFLITLLATRPTTDMTFPAPLDHSFERNLSRHVERFQTFVRITEVNPVGWSWPTPLRDRA